MKRYKVWIIIEEYDTVRLEDGTEEQANWHDVEQEYSNEYASLDEAKKAFNPLVDEMNKKDSVIT